MKVKVHVTLKDAVLDPQGKAVNHALISLGFSGVSGVRIGRYIEFKIDETHPEKIRCQSEKMCRELLANPVIEDYKIELE